MSIWHLIILLVVVVLLFGTSKLRNIGSDLGKAVGDFKKGLNGEDEKADKPQAERLKADEAEPQQAKDAERDSNHSK